MEQGESRNQHDHNDQIRIDDDGNIRFADARGFYWTRFMTSLRPPGVVYWFYSDTGDGRRLVAAGVDDHDLSLEELREQLARAEGVSA